MLFRDEKISKKYYKKYYNPIHHTSNILFVTALLSRLKKEKEKKNKKEQDQKNKNSQ